MIVMSKLNAVIWGKNITAGNLIQSRVNNVPWKNMKLVQKLNKKSSTMFLNHVHTTLVVHIYKKRQRKYGNAQFVRYRPGVNNEAFPICAR